jgi:hypothetical protein
VVLDGDVADHVNENGGTSHSAATPILEY